MTRPLEMTLEISPGNLLFCENTLITQLLSWNRFDSLSSVVEISSLSKTTLTFLRKFLIVPVPKFAALADHAIERLQKC